MSILRKIMSKLKSLKLYLLLTSFVFSASLLTGCGGDAADPSAPHIVSAISTSNTEVLVQFSKTVVGGIDGAENPANYSITAAASSISIGYGTTGGTATEGQMTQLPVHSAVFSNRQSTTVLLTTSSQSSTDYKVTVININDEFGTTIAIDPSSVNFVGTDPGTAENVDSDGDGLRDHVELLGWTVIITNTNGTLSTRHVSSDPGDPNQAVDSPTNIAARDTDSDGVTDNEELHGGIDPRNPDSDGDTLTDNQEWNVIYSDPTNQDTDGDGTQDGFEFYSFRTSPVLADTDGDQISDTDEVLARNRDPRIADLPLHGISIGDVRLQIDERYTYEDAQGKTVTSDSSSSATLTSGETSTRSISGSDNVEAMYEAAGGTTLETTPKPYFSQKVNFTVGREIRISSESATESQRVREQSIGKARELSESNTVTREIVGARIDADMTIVNRGNLAFAISNLEISVLQRSRESTRRFIPVATLIANSSLISGNPTTFNLGPFSPARGPIVFSSRDVFPNLIDEMMQLPEGGLIFEVVNYDITDEYGRVFTFANQIARDRTGGIIIDSGDGQIERHLLATALQPDPDQVINGNFVGGFNGDGSPKGIPIDFALQDIMKLAKNATVADGIVAGIDQMANSIAQGDDVQLIPPGTTGLSVGSIVISAGQNGVLDTGILSILGDDVIEVTTGYETSLTCDANSENAREICSDDNQCAASLTGGGFCKGPETLVRFGSQRTGDFNRQWVVLTNSQLPAGAEFSQLMLKPGEDILFAFVQDLDQDGIFAREEFLSGSTDSSTDRFVNADFGKLVDPLCKDSCSLDSPAETSDGIADSKDTDRDGLGDFAEIRVGWKVSADGGLLTQVFPSPRLVDSDGDGLLDPQEQDLRIFCVDEDVRKDALCNFQDDMIVSQVDAIAIIAGADGIASSLVGLNDDEQLIPQGVTGLAYATQIIGPGANGFIDTIPTGNNKYQSVQSSLRIPPATNPIISDTDADGIEDFAELMGFDIGLSIRDGVNGNGTANTQAIGDDIQQAFLNGPVSPGGIVLPGGIVVLPGPNGSIETPPGADDVLISASSVKTDPLRRDTDADLVADGRERDLGGDPTNPDDGAEFRDSDQDGLSDTEESVLGWLVNVNGLPSRLVLSNPSRPDSDFDGLPDFAERVLRTDPNKVDTDDDGIRDFDEIAGSDFERFFGLNAQFPGFSIDGASSMQYGTNPNHADSDSDDISDYDELLVGYRVFIGGESSFRQVYTNPLVLDTDLDGVDDKDEWFAESPTDATDPDTDDDGRSDGLESKSFTNPLVKDVGVSVTLSSINIKTITDVGGSGGAELAWYITVQKNSEDPYYLSSVINADITPPLIRIFSAGCPYIEDLSDEGDYSFVLNRTKLNTLEEGDDITVRGILFEMDYILSSDCGKAPNYIPSWVESGCVTRFNQKFSFDDFQDGGQASFPFPNGTGTTENCEWEVEIDVKGE
jgi:hypothetical protein